MKFLDEAKLYLRSGDGGAGCSSFRREKFIEFGGPNGGDGGRGGDVIVTCVCGLNTLIDFRYHQHFKAKSGQAGMGQNRTGAKGRDIFLNVPVGVQVLDDDRETVLADMDEVGKSVILLRGGNGGFGNARFKSSVNQAPRRANPGLPGEERWIWLHLKLIADVGLIGLPNAGKSTFLSSVSAARPKIAAYPFTTKHPHLGVITSGYRELVLADIPGLIEGAHEGIGLGDRFLAHVEKCRILLHLVDATSEDVAEDYCVIRHELAAYGHGLDSKSEIAVLSKCDAVDDAVLSEKILELSKVAGKAPLMISSVTRDGVQNVLYLLFDAIDEEICSNGEHMMQVATEQQMVS